ncbi:MAG TPA: hypothetical protein VME70_15260 [Mycobacteriales bacterium]|nr:hypothetical protein [Mycobacteriales bacterium]
MVEAAAKEIADGEPPDLVRAAGQVGTLVERRLRVAASVAAKSLAEAVPRRSATARALEPEFVEVLSDLSKLVSGAGFLAKPGFFPDADLHHSWWASAPGTAVIAEVDLDESSDSFYDYPEKEWFRVPATTGQMSVAGPYVDYLGTNEYILTWGVPVSLSGAFVGAVAADVRLQDMQRFLLASQQADPYAEVLVNAKGRVMFSTSAAVETGSMFRSAAFAAWMNAGSRPPTATRGLEMWPCAGVPWAVLRFTLDDLEWPSSRGAPDPAESEG